MPIISDCRTLAESFRGFQAIHIWRQAIGVADQIAKDARSLSHFVVADSIVLLNDPPSDLLPLLLVDVVGVSHPKLVNMDSRPNDYS